MIKKINKKEIQVNKKIILNQKKKNPNSHSNSLLLLR